ncbi:LPD7 domain-containing protein [uncultured Phenylobacterium sp.]|uniref:LPD7 domain-containing protein n=1 Tax=uncultured Phenylobacterium sp. TaxID=349273 RepID=UPI0025FE8C13|nr:LPD7 domain-containing protein [uncultured Phenylobacterium sp.]
MSGDIDRNQIDSEGRGRSTSKGDVPETLKRRYYLDDRGGPGLGFYADARIQTAAFRDLGARLTSPRSDPNAIRDMAAVAHHRGWTVVVVHGEAAFRREAWLTAGTLGIEVRGYQPTERDRQELERRQAALERKAARTAAERPERGDREARESSGAGRSNMRVVEAVVRARVGDRPAQDRILSAARERLASWLEQGARLRPLDVGRAQVQPESHRARDRQRSR